MYSPKIYLALFKFTVVFWQRKAQGKLENKVVGSFQPVLLISNAISAHIVYRRRNKNKIATREKSATKFTLHTCAETPEDAAF